MFKEFNVEFQDVEMIGGADNLLENTKVTKVVMSGDNKMSSLDSAFKNCSELDNIQGGLDLNGVSNIDNILDGNNLIKNIDLKNINNENISANNSFPSIEEINIGGELYNKKAIQNVIASKEWTFDNFNYTNNVGDNIVTKEVNVIDDNQITIKDTLEQKAKGIEIKGQTYENLVKSEGEYKLIDTYRNTLTKFGNGIEGLPSAIEITEILGNTVQDEADLGNIQSVGDLYVDEEGNPILDEEGNEQYKLEVVSSNSNLINYEDFLDNEGYMKAYKGYKLKKPFYVNAGDKFTLIARGRTLKQDYSSVIFGDRPFMSVINDTTFFMSNGITYTFVKESEEMVDKRYILTANKSGWITYIFIGNSGYNCNLVIEKFGLFKGEVTLENYESYNENKTTILMPQPLRKVDSVSDKLYWDNNKKKYIVEKNIDVITPNISEYGNIVRDEFTNNERFTFSVPSSIKYSKADTSTNDKSLVVSNFIVCSYADYDKIEYRNGICKATKQFKVFFEKGRFTTVEEFKTWFENSGTTFYYSSSSHQIIETKILEKPSLETYSPKTYISTNPEIQPSQMTVNNKKTVIIPEFLDPNRNYTIKFNCTKKGDKPITVNLGGNVLDVDATLGENIIEITTPELIDNKELVLNGNGNIVTDVFVIADNMSTGELQDGGTYKFIISATNTVDTHDMSMIATKPLGTNERLYWNNSNKRYEIDRSGEIEIPTVEGDIIDLPRLYQREDTVLTVECGNIKPSEIKIEYKDLN